MIEEPNCTVTSRSSHLPHGYFSTPNRRWLRRVVYFLIGVAIGVVIAFGRG
jgi:hypothetical protein